MSRVPSIKKQAFALDIPKISICGYRNSGKTTLILRLIEKLSDQFQVGYGKFSHHSPLVFDQPGKDSFGAAEKGAFLTWLDDQKHYQKIHSQAPSEKIRNLELQDCDFLIVEGGKTLSYPKIVFCPPEGKSEIKVEDPVVAWITQNLSQTEESQTEEKIYQRDQIGKISQELIKHLRQDLFSHVPLYGLLLCGGKSQRMGRDKSQLNYHGKPQWEHAYGLLSSVCERTFLSCPEEQTKKRDKPEIFDSFLNFGPFGGLLSAQMSYPEAAWLVLACDLPYVNEKTLFKLKENRDPLKFATVFSHSDQTLEPLCTIYEPKSRFALCQALAEGNSSLRRVLQEKNNQIIYSKEKKILLNVNDFLAYEKTKAEIESKERK